MPGQLILTLMPKDSATDKAIAALVHELCGLTEEEFSIVEGSDRSQARTRGAREAE